MSAKYPSTLLVTLADKLEKIADQQVRRDIETEIRKADLDLLAKINEVAQLIASQTLPTVYRNVITTQQVQNAPTINVWYNLGGSLQLFPGTYWLAWSAEAFYTPVGAGAGKFTLATSSSAETDVDFSVTASSGVPRSPGYRRKRVVIATLTTYYLLAGVTAAGQTNVGFNAGAAIGNIIIEAEKIA